MYLSAQGLDHKTVLNIQLSTYLIQPQKILFIIITTLTKVRSSFILERGLVILQIPLKG